MGNVLLKVFKVFYVIDISSALMVYSLVSWNLVEYMIYFFGIGKEHWSKWFTNIDKVKFNEDDPTIFKMRGIFLYGIFILNIPLFLKKDLGSFQYITIG